MLFCRQGRPDFVSNTYVHRISSRYSTHQTDINFPRILSSLAICQMANRYFNYKVIFNVHNKRTKPPSPYRKIKKRKKKQNEPDCKKTPTFSETNCSENDKNSLLLNNVQRNV